MQLWNSFKSILATPAVQQRMKAFSEQHHEARYKLPVMSCEFGLLNGATNLPFNLLSVVEAGCKQRAASLDDVSNRTSAQRFFKPHLPYRGGVERAFRWLHADCVPPVSRAGRSSTDMEC